MSIEYLFSASKYVQQGCADDFEKKVFRHFVARAFFSELIIVLKEDIEFFLEIKRQRNFKSCVDKLDEAKEVSLAKMEYGDVLTSFKREIKMLRDIKNLRNRANHVDLQKSRKFKFKCEKLREYFEIDDDIKLGLKSYEYIIDCMGSIYESVS